MENNAAERLYDLILELHRIGFPNWEEIIATAEPCYSSRLPEGSLFMYSPQSTDDILYTFLVSPHPDSHKFQLDALEAIKAVKTEQQDDKLNITLHYNARAERIPPRFQIHRDLEKLELQKDEAVAIINGASIYQELRRLGFMVKKGDISLESFSPQGSLISYTEPLEVTPSGKDGITVFQFMVEPHKEHKDRRAVRAANLASIVFTQVVLEPSGDSSFLPVAKSYLLRDGPLPQKNQMIRDVREKASRLDALSRSANLAKTLKESKDRTRPRKKP